MSTRRLIFGASLTFGGIIVLEDVKAAADDANCWVDERNNEVCGASDVTLGGPPSGPQPLGAPVPVGAPEPAHDVETDRGDSSVGLSGSESDRAESSDLDRDSEFEAPGGGTNEPPPACRYVPMRGLTRTRMVNSIDDTGLSGGFVYRRVCDDGSSAIVVRETEEPVVPVRGEPLVPPPPDPAELARELYGEMIVRLPTPTVRAAPAETDPDGWVYVQTPAFFWVDEWAGMSSTLTVGSVSVTLTMSPVRLDVDPGDGGFVSCPHAPAFPAGEDPMSFDGCEYVYKHSSAMAGNGESYPVEASMVWTADWTSNIGVGGSLGEISTVGSRDLQVAEVQALLVEG